MQVGITINNVFLECAVDDALPAGSNLLSLDDSPEPRVVYAQFDAEVLREVALGPSERKTVRVCTLKDFPTVVTQLFNSRSNSAYTPNKKAT